jgi:hypothetical protein
MTESDEQRREKWKLARRRWVHGEESADAANVDADRQYTDEEREFLLTIDGYKRHEQRPFPEWREVLYLLASLGWRKVAPAGPLPTRRDYERWVRMRDTEPAPEAVLATVALDRVIRQIGTSVIDAAAAGGGTPAKGTDGSPARDGLATTPPSATAALDHVFEALGRD